MINITTCYVYVYYNSWSTFFVSYQQFNSADIKQNISVGLLSFIEKVIPVEIDQLKVRTFGLRVEVDVDLYENKRFKHFSPLIHLKHKLCHNFSVTKILRHWPYIDLHSASATGKIHQSFFDFFSKNSEFFRFSLWNLTSWCATFKLNHKLHRVFQYSSHIHADVMQYHINIKILLEAYAKQTQNWLAFAAKIQLKFLWLQTKLL